MNRSRGSTHFLIDHYFYSQACDQQLIGKQQHACIKTVSNSKFPIKLKTNYLVFLIKKMIQS